MAYPHDAFPFPMEHQPETSMFYPQQIQYTPFLQQHQPHPDVLFQSHHYPDYVDFMPFGGMLPEDYDDNAEVSARPRLTKEQVEVLEAQFQAHPKPNSMVKKQLALQTKLTLPRVANWFQNRRAKAKQQRKQEEFEISQGMGTAPSWKEDVDQATAGSTSKTSSPARLALTSEITMESLGSGSPMEQPTSSKGSSWASLQRALDTAETGRPQPRRPEQTHASLSMPPPELPRHNNASSKPQGSSQRAQTLSLSPLSDWSRTQSLNNLASPSPVAMSAPMQDLGFDFGFDQDTSSTSRSNTAEESPENGDEQYVVSADDWVVFPAQATSMSHQNDVASTTQLSPLPLPAYPDSRRGSGSDELAVNLGTFVLAGTPPVAVAPLHQMVAPMRPTDGEIDIASRRKRPRPAALTSAALTSASLRSRSYGQLTSTSPAFRPGPPSGNALRHVKSTGHSLNSHYAGIRKPSLPQRSPLNLASFTEAESLKRLMAQQAAATNKAPLTTPLGPDMSSASASQDFVSRLGLVEDKPTSMALPSEILARYQQLQSPPHTPFQPDWMMQATASMPPPSSVRSQYASFVDGTPPYSAGPLTNSTCWSDAPLHSPDVTGFSSTHHFLGSLAFASQQEPFVHQWVLPSDGAADLGMQQMGMTDDNKKTEFFITEFPGQKEEYASIAQQILQPKPKSYVFANTAPSDYDG